MGYRPLPAVSRVGEIFSPCLLDSGKAGENVETIFIRPPHRTRVLRTSPNGQQESARHETSCCTTPSYEKGYKMGVWVQGPCHRNAAGGVPMGVNCLAEGVLQLRNTQDRCNPMSSSSLFCKYLAYDIPCLVTRTTIIENRKNWQVSRTLFPEIG